MRTQLSDYFNLLLLGGLHDADDIRCYRFSLEHPLVFGMLKDERVQTSIRVQLFASGALSSFLAKSFCHDVIVKRVGSDSECTPVPQTLWNTIYGTYAHAAFPPEMFYM